MHKPRSHGIQKLRKPGTQEPKGVGAQEPRSQTPTAQQPGSPKLSNPPRISGAHGAFAWKRNVINWIYSRF